ncbi:hypothetical protein BG53_09415 [Paenibacillus darwinianus]|uniref:Sporulation membrane protein YtrI C-terminal domain-containing protein n=1 Tax=Paenibacillus darwinianus TaxID=1380763 RepID=A0A9W5W8P3_9BACL|nr:hypothetical protein [Paenibacillus darwinianus]EXX91595.1 hypothetical protein CH50_13360 [Paenibacillus darwinianus]EXX91739.1 hypothetical protein BG53_09415 [Paenibacillus darwinianus]EXX92456.1 hypothetical protein BG52_12685 [Paenibacillus darwinianus]
MRVPPFDRFRLTGQTLGVFVLGAVIGAAAFNGLSVAKFEALVNQIGMLEDQLGQYEQEVRKLTVYKNQHSVIKTVLVHVEESRAADGPRRQALDAVSESQLKKAVKEDLDVFIGRSIYEIDSDARFARLLLDGKVYKGVTGRDYYVEIKTVLVVDNTLRVWVTAKPRSPA